MVSVSLALGMAACGGDTAGADASSDASSSGGQSTGPQTTMPPATTDVPADDGQDDTMTGPSVTDDGDPTGSGASSDDATTRAGDTSTGVTACDAAPDLTVLMMAEDATVVDPMEAVPSIVLPNETVYARSYFAENGTVTFAFDLPCDYDVIAHGLIWDRFEGDASPPNPDSFYFAFDDNAETVWDYGCQTQGEGAAIWSWQALTSLDDDVCTNTQVVLSLPAGTHTLTLRSREDGAGDNFAGIAAIVVTSDANVDPLTLFDPYPA